MAETFATLIVGWKLHYIIIKSYYNTFQGVYVAVEHGARAHTAQTFFLLCFVTKGAFIEVALGQKLGQIETNNMVTKMFCRKLCLF